MQTLWNKKYDKTDLLYDIAPNKFIQESIRYIKRGGRVISLGEGEGRNAVFLAKEGFVTEALDISDIGLRKVQKRAENENVFITIRHTLIENWIPSGKYDAVVSSFMYLEKTLQREMFVKSYDALAKEGVFIGEFFSENQMRFKSGDSKEKRLLYYLPEVYNIIESFTCKIIKISEEIVEFEEERGHNGDACVLRVIFQKV